MTASPDAFGFTIRRHDQTEPCDSCGVCGGYQWRAAGTTACATGRRSGCGLTTAGGRSRGESADGAAADRLEFAATAGRTDGLRHRPRPADSDYRDERSEPAVEHG